MNNIQQIIKQAKELGYIPEKKEPDYERANDYYEDLAFDDAIDSFQLEKIIELAYEEWSKDIRWSWDIADGTDDWCVQIWQGNTLLDSITKKSDDGGCVKLKDTISNLSNKED